MIWWHVNWWCKKLNNVFSLIFISEHIDTYSLLLTNYKNYIVDHANKLNNKINNFSNYKKVQKKANFPIHHGGHLSKMLKKSKEIGAFLNHPSKKLTFSSSSWHGSAHAVVLSYKVNNIARTWCAKNSAKNHMHDQPSNSAHSISAQEVKVNDGGISFIVITRWNTRRFITIHKKSSNSSQ